MRPVPPRGFSLIELMTTLTVLAILILIGIPSYEQWMLNTRIRTATESIQNGLRLARSEASQRATFVRFQSTSATDATWTVCQLPATAASAAAVTSCTGQTTIQQVLADNTNGVQIGATTVVADIAAGTGIYGTPITGGVPAGITYTALGRPSDYGNTSIVRIDISAAQAGSRRLVTTISAGGMVNMCDPAIPFNATSSTQGCP
ncbi:prepilin-type N-terminal cleavage/methylation domain-containing protein [Rhodanobacter sp. MP7CTX1]|uniref:pilus assembly FimT family protein n=1 Tax=Rhodanobacter sp. MP7CTX1 TaxID=2723084 RepID=UPI00161EE635|nr:prepilin-type N-terminal cleavage/methylation domain-containing protein [Rhodanobacter sp. MP7CTX1]MBB6188805.1 type IV fimbrial biogenesis protein FimT [Rhodanobacter sp. MP7CTX1]